MKVGTDGVLLGAWVDVRPRVARILDIGTGTGLIALMMAQRAVRARIVGVDVEDVAQARENADASPWGGRVEFVQCPVQEYLPHERFDLIVSNPPFFVDSLTCPDAGRTTARHAVRLPFDELCDAVVRLLAPGGRFALILPADEAARFLDVSRARLIPTRRTDVRTTPRRPVKRVLMEFIRLQDAHTVFCGHDTSAAVAAEPFGRPDTGPAAIAAEPFGRSDTGPGAVAAEPFRQPDTGPWAVAAEPFRYSDTSAAAVAAEPFRHSETAPAASATVPLPPLPAEHAAAEISASAPGVHPASATTFISDSAHAVGSATSHDPVHEAYSASSPARPFPAPVCTELVIGTGEHEQYTPQYRALTRDFYLKF